MEKRDLFVIDSRYSVTERWRGLAFFVAATLLNACSTGNGEGLDGNGRPLGESGGPQPLTPTFGSIQVNVFDPFCTICHSGANAPQGLRLDAANSYALLVGVRSSEVPSVFRVAPSDPNASYLIQKLEGSAAVGQQMPLGGPPLPQTTIDVIRQWITDGALADSQTPPTAGPPVVVSTSPTAESELT